MARAIFIWLPSTIALALCACGGSSEGGFFSDIVSGAGGTGHAGTTSRAGSTSSSGGPSSAGSPSNAGSPSSAGSPSTAGQGGASAGSGGAQTAGASSGGRAGSTSSGGTGGSGATGGGGAAAGHGGSQSGSSGSGGANQSTCNELLKQANQQLDEARACNFAANSQQCTGTVKNPCNCEVSVHRDDAPETKAYLATLKQIMANNCVQVCTAALCKPVTIGQCKQSGSSTMGMCVAASNGPGPSL